jgi:hypothetical protein
MARTTIRHRLPSAPDTQQWLVEANAIAERERRYRRARADYLQVRRRLDELRHAHAVLVNVIAERAGVVIGTPGAVPDGLDVPGHHELVSAIHAVEPWFPPPDACVRGATIDDAADVIRVLIALERGHTLTAACQLATADGIARSPAGDRLRKRVLGGQVKTGQLGTGQMRPVVPGQIMCKSIPVSLASRPGVWFASCAVRT